jgi:hypothetical protein
MIINLLPHEHIEKIFIEKPPVTSSNCYESMKNASILKKLGTNVDWTIASVTACSIVHFLLSCNGGTSQNCHNSLFCIVFFIKSDFKVVQLLNDLR